jgi:hypothetical protein
MDYVFSPGFREEQSKFALASEMHRARRRSLNQHGVEYRPIEPPASLLGVE